MLVPITWILSGLWGAFLSQDGMTNGTMITGLEPLPRPEGHYLKKLLDPKLITAIAATLGMDKMTDWIMGTNKELDQLLGLLYFVAAIIITIGFAVILMIIWCIRKDRRARRQRRRTPEV